MHEYRHYITSLRGYSVLFIFFFHLDIAFFKNGYLGVDIFFLISGFVITSSLIKKWNGNFLSTSVNFYFSRLKRIFPNLFFILTSVLIISLFIIPIEHIVHNLNYYVSSILGLSNLQYLFETKDYFDDTSNFFSHTWSLGVEIQFYILIPLILFLFLKKNKNLIIFDRKKKYILFFLILASLLIYIYFSLAKNFNAAFYLTPLRIWEFLIGSFLFLINKEVNKKNYYSIISFIIIIFIIVFGNSKNLFLINLIIIFLTSVFILNYDRNYYFDNKIVYFIGSISYSFYLWHLPIIFLSKYFYEISLFTSLIIFFLTTLFSFLTYEFIELRFKKFKLSLKLQKFFKVSFLPFFILMVFFVILFSNNSYVKSKVKYFLIDKNYYEKNFDWDNTKKFSKVYLRCANKKLKLNYIDECVVKSNNNNNILFYIEGNSFAANFLEMFTHSKIVKNAYYSHVPGYKIRTSNLLKDLEYLKKSYETVYYSVIIQNDDDLDSLIKNFLNFKNYPNINLLIIGPIPNIEKSATHPIDCLKYSITCKINIKKDRVSRDLDKLNESIEFFINDNIDYKIVYYNPYKDLCQIDLVECTIYDEDNKKLYFRDRTHLTIEGSTFLSEFFDNHLKKELFN